MNIDLFATGKILICIFLSVGSISYLLTGSLIMAKASFLTCILLFLWAWGFSE